MLTTESTDTYCAYCDSAVNDDEVFICEECDSEICIYCEVNGHCEQCEDEQNI